MDDQVDTGSAIGFVVVNNGRVLIRARDSGSSLAEERRALIVELADKRVPVHTVHRIIREHRS